MKDKKGITLIALIITIIVMLILVGVTINIAINGGLFGTAQVASRKMEREVAKEKLIAATVGAYDSNGNFVKANVVLPEGMSWDTDNANCVIADNGEIFYVDPNNGTVLDEEPTKDDIEYYGIEMDGAEMVLVVNYIQKNVKLYVGEINNDLFFTGDVLTGNAQGMIEETITIKLDDVNTQVSNVIPIYYDGVLIAYIGNGKLYMGDINDEGTSAQFSSEAYYSLYSSFDATRLKEEP